MFEQGARFLINGHGQSVISNNMLEGQNNPIEFNTATVPVLHIHSNYIEGISGDFFIKVSGGVDQRAIVTVGENWPTSWGGQSAKYGFWLQDAAVVKMETSEAWQTTPGCYLAFSERKGTLQGGSVLPSGIALDYENYSNSAPIASGLISNFRDWLGAKAVSEKKTAIGSTTFDGPFGSETTTGYIQTSPSFDLSDNLPDASVTYEIGDVVLICAIVKNLYSESANVSSTLYENQNGVSSLSFGTLGSKLAPVGWSGYFVAVRVKKAGTTVSPNIRITGDAELYIHSYTAQVLKPQDLYGVSADQFLAFPSF
jgi:hypothetical protein